jgi:subtilase family protein
MRTAKSKSNAGRTRRRSQPTVKKPTVSRASVRKKGRSTQHDDDAARSVSALKLATPTPINVRPTIAKATESLIVTGGAVPEVQTVIYVHGIGNKPVASVLKCQWDSALFGAELGDRSRMAYWVNREYYPVPTSDSCGDGDVVRLEDDEASTRSIMTLAGTRPVDEHHAVELEIEALQDDPAKQQFLRSVADKMLAAGQPDQSAITVAGVSAKLLPLPEFLRRLITRQLTRVFLRDVNDFLFDQEKREAMEQSLIDRIEAGGGPFVIIAHSQGTMIAYNVLRQLSKSECDVRLFVTIGSPLGLQEVQDVFKSWTQGALTVPQCVSHWVNVADRIDPVAVDSDLRDDFSPANAIENHRGWMLNPDSPRHPHSGSGYLRTSYVRTAVRDAVGNAFAQPVARTIIAKDLVTEAEDSFRKERHMALVQLQSTDGISAVTLTTAREQLTGTIQDLVKASGDRIEDAEIEPLKRYVAAKLTRLELEQLRTQFADLKIERVWRNAIKKALIHESTHVVQAAPANVAYDATGRDICWAVLDTGICADHPHFESFSNIARQWDCTVSGKPQEVNGAQSATLDGQGHGTHVAGIIAGKCNALLGLKLTTFSGMAPEAKLFGLKVLDDQGNGRDSWIIKGLDLIADLNEQAGALVVHGVNLSLGGNFDPSVYGCGHTPLCEELRRLWRQGVLVCLAAGNEGYALLQAESGEVPANMDLSIGDPANLEEAIAVGSINKGHPHTYGVSFFSSRGPTADGRKKPDVVAPGERILSALHKWKKDSAPDNRTANDLYVEMSGTSMAAPHVSGLLAAFLSRRREFISYPDDVKTLLLDSCTDLARDCYIQGRGVPNLMKMLANC